MPPLPSFTFQILYLCVSYGQGIEDIHHYNEEQKCEGENDEFGQNIFSFVVYSYILVVDPRFNIIAGKLLIFNKLPRGISQAINILQYGGKSVLVSTSNLEVPRKGGTFLNAWKSNVSFSGYHIIIFSIAFCTQCDTERHSLLKRQESLSR